MKIVSRVLGVALLLAMPLSSCICEIAAQPPSPAELTAVAPDRGYNGEPVTVQIQGSSLELRITQDPGSPDGVVVDGEFIATLGDEPLGQVTWVDNETLTAVVPEGIAAGTYELTVTTPFGTTVSLPSAYTATAQATPTLVRAEPANVVNDADTPVTLVGTNLDAGLAVVAVDADGNETALAVSATDGDSATVTAPADLAAGVYAIVARIDGLEVRLDDALTVHDPATLAVALSPDPELVSLDDTFTLTVTVTNDGATAAEGTAPDTPTLGGSGTATLQSGPVPQSADIAAGESATFTFTYSGDAAGDVTIAARARGTNEYSGREVVSPEATSPPVLVEVPATLSAVWATPATVSVGQTFVVDLEVTNDGESTASSVSPSLETPTGPGALTLVGTVDPATADIAAGATATFSFTYTATTPGDVTLSGRATGTDSVSGDSLTSGLVTANAFTVQTPAALTAAWDAQASATVNQTLEIRLNVNNTGEAAAVNVLPAAPTVTTTGNASATVATEPAQQTIPGGGSHTFTWTYTVGADTGTLAFSTAAAGTDANSQTAVSSPTATSNPITVQTPPVLVGTLSVPGTLSSGQTVDVVLVVENQGQATAAQVQPNQLMVNAGGTGATATPGTPPAPADIAAGQTVTFSYPYTLGAGLGQLTFSGDASGVDANTGLPVATPGLTSNTATVEAGANLVAAFQVPTVVSVGQSFNVIVTVQNDGDADALVVAPESAPGVNPGNRASFVSGPVPTSATVDGGGGTAQFSYQYLAETEGTATFSVDVAGTDANSSQTVTSGTATSDAVTVNPAPDLAANLIVPSAVTEGQTFTVEMTVTNNGVARLDDVLPILPLTQVPAGAANLVTAPDTPQDVNGNGGQATFTWTFTAGAAQQFLFEGAASGTDAQTQQTVTSPTVQSAAIDIQTPVDLVLAWTTPTSVTRGADFTATLSVTNNGGATANDVTPAAAVLSGATGTTCQAADPATTTLQSAASQDFTYTCTAGNASGDETLSVAVAAVDANSDAALNFGPALSDVVAVQSAPALALAWTLTLQPSGDVSYGQVFQAQLEVENTGEASATVTPTATVVGATNTTCSTAVVEVQVAGGATETIDYTCTAGDTSGVFSLDGSVSGTDDNDGVSAVTAGPENSGDADNESPVVLTVTIDNVALPDRVAFGDDNFTVSVIVTNDGEAGAAGVAPANFVVNGASGASCGAPDPTSADIAGEDSQRFDYTCSSTAPSEVASFTAGATGTDENSTDAKTGADVTSDDVIIGAPAALAVDAVTPAATTVYRADEGRVVTVTVRNDGEAPADVSALTLSFDNGGDVTGEYVVTPDNGNPTEVLAGAPATFTFTVDIDANATGGTVTIDAAVTAVDRWENGIDASDAGADTPGSWIVNTPPVACFVLTDLQTAREIGDPFAVDASCSTDAEGHTLTYDWDLENDGTFDALDTGTTANLTYTVPGVYEMTLRVTDEANDSHYYSLYVAAADTGTLVLVGDNNGNTLAAAVGTAGNTVAFDPTVFDGTPTTIDMGNTNLTPANNVRVFGQAGVQVQADRQIRLDNDGIVFAYLEIFGGNDQGGQDCMQIAGTGNRVLGSLFRDCNAGARDGIELTGAGNTIGPGNEFASGLDNGVQIQAGDNQVIVGNVFHDCGADCLSSPNGTDGHVVERNTIYNAGDDGIAIGAAGADGVQVLHNTIDAAANHGVRLFGGAHTLRNNLLTNNVTGDVCDESTALDADYNGRDGNGVTGCTGNGANANDVNADPLYADQPGNDYTLTVGSPAIDAGDPAVATDTNGAGAGTYWGTAPDLGALETNYGG